MGKLGDFYTGRYCSSRSKVLFCKVDVNYLKPIYLRKGIFSYITAFTAYQCVHQYIWRHGDTMNCYQIVHRQIRNAEVSYLLSTNAYYCYFVLAVSVICVTSALYFFIVSVEPALPVIFAFCFVSSPDTLSSSFF